MFNLNKGQLEWARLDRRLWAFLCESGLLVVQFLLEWKPTRTGLKPRTREPSAKRWWWMTNGDTEDTQFDHFCDYMEYIRTRWCLSYLCAIDSCIVKPSQRWHTTNVGKRCPTTVKQASVHPLLLIMTVHNERRCFPPTIWDDGWHARVWYSVLPALEVVQEPAKVCTWLHIFYEKGR